MRLLTALLFAALMATNAAFAAPRAYALDQGSKVTFSYTMLGARATGTIPILTADLSLDFVDIERSRAKVELNARGIDTTIGFVTDALKGSQVLWTDTHPVIRFDSSRISGTLSDARIGGEITIRGVTRPVELTASVYRRAGSEEGDLTRLTVLLKGSILRSAFGANGYADQVADRIDLDITARLRAID